MKKSVKYRFKKNIVHETKLAINRTADKAYL